MLETQFIKKLQQKPDSIKRVVMWFGVFLVMAVIFTFWLSTFPSQIAATENDETAANSDASVGAPTSWRRGLNKELPGVWQSLRGQINNFEGLWQK